jgi:hypothetical protein
VEEVLAVARVAGRAVVAVAQVAVEVLAVGRAVAAVPVAAQVAVVAAHRRPLLP